MKSSSSGVHVKNRLANSQETNNGFQKVGRQVSDSTAALIEVKHQVGGKMALGNDLAICTLPLILVTGKCARYHIILIWLLIVLFPEPLVEVHNTGTGTLGRSNWDSCLLRKETQIRLSVPACNMGEGLCGKPLNSTVPWWATLLTFFCVTCWTQHTLVCLFYGDNYLLPNQCLANLTLQVSAEGMEEKSELYHYWDTNTFLKCMWIQKYRYSKV